ncbi:MAG: glycosyltransferase [Flavobacteriales bacterium]|nr:glycosyltransferase [Flavobacteriales bacterium]
MNILFFANRIPFPPHRGDKLKIYNLARRIAKNHTLYLIAFVEQKSDFQYQKQLEEIFDEVHLVYLPVWKSWLNSALNFFGKIPFQLAYFKSKKMADQLHDFLENHSIDVIHTQHLRMSQYTRNITNIPRILDLPDAYSLYWQRRKTVKRPLLNRIFDALESKRVVQYEKVVYDFDLNLVCSVEDRDHLLNIHPKSNIGLLRNGVDLETFAFKGHNYSRNKTLLFTGNMDYAPNVDAVLHFVENIFPKIKSQFPDIEFVVAGQRPLKSILDLASADVKITGFVEDISKMYEQADVVVAPLRFGAGTQNKVLEAMAMGVPVVCTDIGFKGLEIATGDGVFHANDDTEFISHVVKLLSSEELRKKTGEKGLSQARGKFSWDGISADLEAHFLSLKN